MEETKRPPRPIRFGNFEVDLQSGELRRQGFKVRLQEQPFQVLKMLLERPGEIVTREALQKRLWPVDTFVDFERGLNRAINKLREALDDDAESPHLIETLPRRGYRFLAPVETAGRGTSKWPEASLRSYLRIIREAAEQLAPAVVAPWRQVLPWAVAGVLALIAGIAVWRPGPFPPTVADRPLLQLDLDTGPEEFSQLAISPDGTRIVLVSKDGLAIRRLDQPSDQSTATRLADTHGAYAPFFSPNGKWVAFFAGGELQKVAVDGGPPIVLCDAPDPGGGTWGADDSIVAALDSSRGLSRIPAAGGVPRSVTNSRANPSDTRMHRSPQALPDGTGVLFADVNASGQGSLRVLTPNDGKLKTVVENSTQGRLLGSGYLIYHQQATLYAVPIDPLRLELVGPPVALVNGVSSSGDHAEFDLSTSGTLVYRAGSAENSFTISWVDSFGKTESVVSKPGNYSVPCLSPDGTRLAVSVIMGGEQSIWVYALHRETWARVTSEHEPEMLPRWTPDGEFLVFRSGNNLAWTRADGSGKMERLEAASPNAAPWSFSADGKWLAFWPLQPDSDLWIVPVERGLGMLQLGHPRLLLGQAGSKGAPAISPDDRWVAYTSAESGRFEIYVMPFSPQGTKRSRKWLVSNGGGGVPTFSRNGHELYYQSLDRKVRVVAYRVQGDSFIAEKARAWSETPLADMGFDVAPDGKRVLGLFAAEHPKTQTVLRVMLNVDSELRRRGRAHGK